VHYRNHLARPAWGNSLLQSQRAESDPSLDDVLDWEEARVLLVAAAIRQQQGTPPTREEIDQIRRSMKAHAPMSKPAHVPKPMVYYFRVGNRIKIGHTTNLAIRIKDLAPEEVLGWEPGPPPLEKQRHREFRQHRTAREWFKDCDAIRRHIAESCYPYPP
jgi:T5orf172 domain.